MTKRSRHERAARAAETERIREIERAWAGSVPADTAAAFSRSVEAARARGPVPPPPNMAPGTQPNPPRPGREPKAPKDQSRSRRGRQVPPKRRGGHGGRASRGDPAAPNRDMPRPNLAAVNPDALRGRGSFRVGARVRILGTGLYAGEAGTVEAAPGGVIPSALVRTDAGQARRVRTIDLEPLEPGG